MNLNLPRFFSQESLILNNLSRIPPIIGLLIVILVFPAYSQYRQGPLLPINEDGHGGFINNKGKLVIPFKFDWALDRFSEGLALVRVNEKYAFIRSNGEIAFELPIEVAAVYSFSEGRAKFKLAGKWGYVDTSGKIVIQPIYAYAHAFAGGLAHVQLRADAITKDGYVDRDGTIVIGFRSFAYLTFSEGVAFDLMSHTYVDKRGIPVFPAESYPDGGEFSEGLAPVEIDSKWGFIDKAGSVVIKPQFDWAGKFSEGLALVRLDKTQFIIPFGTYKGRTVISAAFGFIDQKGKVIIRPQFMSTDPTYSVPNDNIGNFSEGLARVRDAISGKWGYISQSGKVIIEPKFDKADDFIDGVATVEIDEKEAYITKSGEYIWREK